MLKQVEVCDVCEVVGRAVEEYSVSRDGRQGVVALCAEDGAPFERALKEAAPAATHTRHKAATTTSRRRSPVTTIADIERKKARNAEKAPA